MTIALDRNITSVVFIDGSLADLQAILAGLDPSVTAIILDPAQDGIGQMADALVGVSGLASIHIISHGSSGQLNLGAAQLSQDTLAQYQTQLATIGNALSATGDLLLYGCNVAQGAQGQAFIAALANATGADVAASTDLTGNALLGGNWTLEAVIGAIEANTLNANIAGVLAVINGTAGNDTLTAGAGGDTIYGLAGDDTLNGGAGNDWLDGGDGNDWLVSVWNSGNDTLLGGNGNDYFNLQAFSGSTAATVVLDGGAGDDYFYINNYAGSSLTLTATGGLGIDTYQFLDGANTASYTVTDFTAGIGGDRIEVATLLTYSASIGGYVSGNNPFAASGYLRVTQHGLDTWLEYDEDGAGITYGFHTAMVLQNVTATALTADNFVGGIPPDGTIPVVPNGTAGNDTLTGSIFNDTIYGYAGSDTINGGGGNDIIYGGDEVNSWEGDNLNGGAGNDTLYGGAGNDYLYSYSGEGSDVLNGDVGNDIFFINSYAITATPETVVVNGGAGDDLIQTQLSQTSGNRILTATGGAGVDTYQFNSGDATASYTVTDFTAGIGGDRIDVLALLTYSTSIGGYASGSNPFAVANRYLKVTQHGADTWLEYDEDGAGVTYGFHTAMVLQNTTTVLLGVTVSTLTADNFVGGFPLDGTIPAPVLNGTAGNDTLTGSFFNDTINGLAGSDNIDGGAGNDIINPRLSIRDFRPSFMPKPMQSRIDCGLSPKPFKPLPSPASHSQSQYIFLGI